MSLDLLIRGGTVVTGQGSIPSDLGIADGRIAEIGTDISSSHREAIDATGLVIFPGVIDAHVHFNEPGRTNWEGIASGSRSLAAGGGTCFFDMPLNSSPPTLDGASFDVKLLACQRSSVTDYALWGGLTPANLDRLGELAERGVIGFKAFMCSSGIDDFPHCDDSTLLKGMQIAARLGLPVAVHAESQALTSVLAERARELGNGTPADYLASRPVLAELEAIQRAILFASETGCSLHIVHVSHPNCLAWARQLASLRKCELSCETCPHYLLLNADDLGALGAVAKCAPPLREESARAELVRVLHAGQIDTIGSDHSPSPNDMKMSDSFFEIWGGISGVQITLRALLTLGLDLDMIARLLSENVARRFGIPSKGAIAIGRDADLTLIDPATQTILEREELLDRHRLSPYLGRVFRGTVRSTFVRGRRIFKDGKIVSQTGGRLVRPMGGTL